MGNLKNIFTCCVIFLQVQMVSSQDLSFLNIGVKDGLSNNRIFDIVQDQKGFMWIATANGLNRYDGYNFITLKNNPDNPNSLSANVITDLMLDSKGNLWVGTNDGLNYFDTKTYSITRFLHDPSDNNSISHNYIRTLYLDSQERLWAGTYDGLALYDSIKNNFRTFYHSKNDPTTISHNLVRAIYEDKDGIFWIGTYDGLNTFNSHTGKFNRIKLAKPQLNDPPNDLILTIGTYDFQPEEIWAGTVTGLYKINRKNFSYERYGYNKNKNLNPSNKVIKAFGQLYEGYIPIGTDYGFNLFSPFSGEYVKYYYNQQDQKSISNNVVWCILKDKSGLLWLGTDNGISITDPYSNKFTFNRIKNYKIALPDNYIRASVETSNGSVWLGTNNGIFLINPKDGTTIQYKNDYSNPKSLSNDKVAGLFIDSYDQLWCLTSEGLNKLITGSSNFDIYTHNEGNLGLSSNYMSSIAESSDKSIWIGTFGGGVNRLIRTENNLEQPIEKKFIKYFTEKNNKNSLSSNRISDLIVDSEDNLWICTIDKGVIHYNYKKNIFTRYYHSSDHNSIPSNAVGKAALAPNGTVWFATTNGICFFNKEKNYFERVDLPEENDLSIIKIIVDNHNKVWFNNQTKIFNYDPKENKTFSYDISRVYNIGAFSRLIYKTRKGLIFFGCVNGLLSFDPQEIKSSRFVPQIQISNLKINNQEVRPGTIINNRIVLKESIDNTDELFLKDRDKTIYIEFSALQYESLYENKYAYMLQGFDQDWIYTSGRNNSVVYSNLKSGKYLFRLRATNNDGAWIKEEKTLAIKVAPPWYTSVFALIFYGLIIFSVLFLSIKVIIVGREKDRIKNLNQLKLRFFTNISHEFKTPLTLILLPIENLLRDNILEPDKVKELLYLIKRNAQRLRGLIDQLMYFRKIEAGKLQLLVSEENIITFLKNIFDSFTVRLLEKKLHAEFIVPEGIDKIMIYFDFSKMETVFANLISNAIKYTYEGGSVKLEVQKAKEGIEVTIKDTGIGIPDNNLKKIFERFYQVENKESISQGTGIGLALVKEILEHHNGTVSVSSEQGKGSEFKVFLKAGKDHLKSNVSFETSANQNSDLIKGLIDEDLELNKIAKPASNETEDENKENVLIVEDDVEIRKFIINELSGKYFFFESGNGKDGYEKAASQSISLIITDVMMPIMDGNEFCQLVKNDINTSHIPVIMLTAKSSVDNQIEGISSGADSYIPKPFDIRHLEVTMDKLIENRKKLRELFSKDITLEPSKVTVTSVDERFLNRLMEVIENNISNFDFNVDYLCKKMKISQKQLTRKTKALLGQTANEVIRDIRLKRAIQLLEKGGFNMSEISYECGFATPAYFTKCFKEKFGYTPSKYIENKDEK